MIDHLVYATSELAVAVPGVASKLSVELHDGGAHDGLGTRNHLASLGGGTYLEVIGPDPAQPDPDGPRPFRIDDLDQDGIVSWCVQPRAALEATRSALVDAGFDCTEPFPMSRRRPDGVLLEWRLMFLAGEADSAVVPFFIDWGGTAHPSDGLRDGVDLVALHIHTAAPSQLESVIDAALGDDERVHVSAGEPSLMATLRTTHGDVVL